MLTLPPLHGVSQYHQVNAAYPNRMGILYIHLVDAYQSDKFDILSDSFQ